MTDITYLFHGRPPYRAKTIYSQLTLINEIRIVINKGKGPGEEESITIDIDNAKEFVNVISYLIEEAEASK